MKLEYKDIKKIENIEFKIPSKKIFDINKFVYWNEQSEHFIELMNINKDDKNKYRENFHQAILSELEKNKYFKISKREFLVLLTMLKYHNHLNSERKVFMDKNGRKVKSNDRRAIK